MRASAAVNWLDIKLHGIANVPQQCAWQWRTLPVPVIAAVSPYFREEWRLFAGPLAEDVEPTPEALADWWTRARGRV